MPDRIADSGPTQQTDAPAQPATGTSRAPLARGLITAAVLVAATAFGFTQLATQPAAPANAPANQFSATRAMATLHGMAGTNTPRPIGSAENNRVRAQLVAEVKALGYHPVEQATQYTSQATSPTKSIAVNPPQDISPLETANSVNILTRVPGTDPDHSGAVLLAGHYDSVPSGPGAGDDGHSAAAFVEVLRAMKNLPPLKHDVIFMMTDGEEPGERGARAFVAMSPWAKDVRYVLNFEARGVEGKDLFFEANQMSPNLLSKYAASQPRPQTGALFYEIFKRLKNNTDFSVFTSLDKPGLSFAFIGGLNRYHTPGDSIENLSTGSVQYAGDMMLGLLQGIANQDSLAAAPAEEMTWFNIASLLISYPNAVSYLLIILGLGIWVGALVVGRRRRLVTGRAVGRGAGTAVVAVVAAVGISQLMLALIYLVRPDNQPFISLVPKTVPDPYRVEAYGISITAMVVAATVALFVFAARKQSIAGLALGALAVWAVLAILTQVEAPAGSYTFAIPFLLLSSALLVRVIWDRPWITLAADLIAAAVVLIFMVPVLVTSFQALSLSSVAIISLLVALVVSSLCAVLEPLRALWKWSTPIVFAIVSVAVLIPNIATPLVNANHQQPDTLVYSINGDTKSATWLSYDKKPDQWTQNALGTNPAREPAPPIMIPFFPSTLNEETVMTAPAKAVLPLTGPALTIISDKSIGANRVVNFTVNSTRDALNLSYTMNTSGQLKGVTIGNQVVPTKSANTWSVIGYATPRAGYNVTVTLTAGASLQVVATDMTYGFPPTPALGLPSRPDWSMWHQEPHAFQLDPVMVTKTYKIG